MAAIELAPDLFLGTHIERPAFLLKKWEGSNDLGARIWASIGMGQGFVAAKADCADTASQTVLAQAGFYPADVNLTMEVPARMISGSPAGARKARPEDRNAVGEIAGGSFLCSRFHRDPNIGRDKADRFKRAWAENFFEGKRGDAMIVAENDGVVSGFLQLLLRDGVMTIDLIAVREQDRGKGLGTAMLAKATAELPGYATIRTGTQAANIGSIRFYENLGFRMTASTMVMHLWKEQDK